MQDRVRRRRVMIIDDSDIARELVHDALVPLGVDITTRATPVGAQVAILRERPDVILLDLSMPIIGGDDLAAALRAHPALRRTVILLCSSQPREEIEARMRACGADGLIEKGDPAAMAREVASWLARGRQDTRPLSILVAQGDRDPTIERALGTAYTMRVTHSGADALRLSLSSQDRPDVLVLATDLEDIAPERVLRALVERDPAWRQKVLLVGPSEPAWADGCAFLPIDASQATMRDVVARMVGAE